MANCEHRQAEEKYGAPKLHALVQKYKEHQAELQPAIEGHVKEYEAKGHDCLAVQVLKLVDEYAAASDSSDA